MTDGEQMLEGMEHTTKFSFVGVKYESMNNDFQRGQEVEFRVRGHVKGVGEEDFSQGPMNIVKVAVDSVVPVSFAEPDEPPAGAKVMDGESLFSDDDGGDD